MPEYTLSVNGTRRTVDVPEDTPLLWVLRDTLGLTGTKYGCGIGQCRSCTVHVDGKPVFSCMVKVSSAASKEILTIEGLSEDGSHPVQQAWVRHEVPQCGWCQPGQILTAVALLRDHPDPTDEQIEEAMGPVLCRCGTYPRIRQAIRSAAKGGAQ
jgi:isoquinoline 1-oxidoreductase alpha subunit